MQRHEAKLSRADTHNNNKEREGERERGGREREKEKLALGQANTFGGPLELKNALSGK